jgi:hypothetical protein
MTENFVYKNGGIPFSKCGICKDKQADHVLFFETYEMSNDYNKNLGYLPNEHSHITGRLIKIENAAGLGMMDLVPSHCQCCALHELKSNNDSCLGLLTYQSAAQYLRTKETFSQHVSELNINGYTIINKEKICNDHELQYYSY